MGELSNRPSYRADRMADLIREEVASYLTSGNKNPMIGFVTVTRVSMTKDLQIARIYYLVLGSEKEKAETVEGIRDSLGRIRSHLAKTIKARYTPKLEFYVDDKLEESYRVQSLLENIKDGE